RFGNSAAGTVGAALGDGWLRLDTQSRYPVRTGFSGAGVWSSGYAAVVALVGQANPSNGDARAISLVRASHAFTELGRQAAPRWSARHARGATRHCLPRSRGVGNEAERGFRFRGRPAALTDLPSGLDGATEGEVLVVPGPPGVGKPAVLGRRVVPADPEVAATLP